MAKLPSQLVRGLGSRVRKLREHERWTQKVLADRAGLDRSYIAGIEAGLRNPSLKALHKVARGLGVSLSQLVANID
jgi:transcriptional regulator with XRE-family HTH domain